MITILIAHWKKIVVICGLTIAILFSYQQGYKNRELIAIKEQLILQEKLSEAKKVEVIQTDKVVTEYKTKIVTVDKLIPYFIDRTKTDITDEENAKCILPNSFIRIYKDSIGVAK